jgi:hypothetical protein
LFVISYIDKKRDHTSRFSVLHHGARESRPARATLAYCWAQQTKIKTTGHFESLAVNFKKNEFPGFLAHKHLYSPPIHACPYIHLIYIQNRIDTAAIVLAEKEDAKSFRRTCRLIY